MEQVDQLDHKERKKLFDDFVSHGGKVVGSNANAKKTGMIQLTSQRNKVNNSSKEENEKEIVVEKKIVDSKKYPQNEILSEEQFQKILKTAKLQFFSHFIISIKNFFAKTTDFSGFKLHLQFKMMTNQIQESVKNIHIISLSIMRSRSFRKVDIAESFFKNFALFYEIILRFALLKVDSLFKTDKPTSWERVNIVAPYYLKMMKMLYAFFGKEDFILSSYKKAYQVMINLKEIDIKTVTTNVELLKKHINHFSIFMRKLEILFPLLCGFNLTIESPAARRLLEVNAQGVLGGLDQFIEERFYKLHHNLSNEDEEFNENNINIDEDKGNEEQTEPVQKGLHIIQNINLEEMLENYPELSSYELADKIRIIALLLEFFSRNYSIVLYGKKMKINQTIEQGKRVNIQDSFNEFYIEYEKLKRKIKDYTYVIKMINNEKSQRLLSDMEDSLKDQRSQINSAIRYQARIMLEKIMNPLESIIQKIPDYVADYNVPLQFNGQIFDGAHFEGVTPENLIMEFYSYIKSILFLLLDGDLSGPSPVISKKSIIFAVNPSLSEETEEALESEAQELEKE